MPPRLVKARRQHPIILRPAVMSAIQKFIEERHPIVLATLAGVAAWRHPIVLPEDYLADVIGSSLTMCAVFLGFMATSMSILISYRGTRLAQELRGANVMEQLVNYLRGAIGLSILWLLVSFLLYFFRPHWLLVSWAVLATLSLTSYIRVVTLLSKLILE